MTPTQIIQAARSQYNSVGDTFYADSDLLMLLYKAEMEMALFANTIEAYSSSTSTVIGTRSYTLPTRTIEVKRVTYDGQKLKPIAFSEDDAVTFLNESDTTQGTPLYYMVWNGTIYLRNIPNAVKTLAFYYYKEPTILTISDTLETPTRYHMDLVDCILSYMVYKDENSGMGDRYRASFDKALIKAREFERKRKRTDQFNYVKDDSYLVKSVLGVL